MTYLIGMFAMAGKTIPKLINIRDYNEAVPKLNKLLSEKKLIDIFFPQEKPEIAKELGIM